MTDEQKLCDGCGKDLSNDSAYPSGFDADYGKNRTQLWRCAPCKIAKDTHRIAQLEKAIHGSLNALANVSPNDAPDVFGELNGIQRTLSHVLTGDPYPSLGRKKDEVEA